MNANFIKAGSGHLPKSPLLHSKENDMKRNKVVSEKNRIVPEVYDQVKSNAFLRNEIRDDEQTPEGN
ncbi:hypothetical protein KIN20_007899 [Parelaphostrongylus tenuis]|uniref:Uncharacterized protein n=1 Tax=Parelaphostrongylus tenuis TaxID=148309 RepID=A0AAD5QH45_PARTN|nr:hypothetical protein KIN20_007899 [Parelaphostrongylus tenuis]